MAVDLKQASRRLLEEAYGKGNFDVFDEICDRSYRGHDPLTGEADLKQTKESCKMYKAAFPDLGATILGAWTDGDTVVTHWRMSGTHERQLLGIAPTGRRCTVEGISIDKFRGGKLVEDWTQWDALGLFRQLGVAPALETGAAAQTEMRPH